MSHVSVITARASCTAALGPTLLVSLQILVELAELQDQEVGDGTTSVVIVAAEILKRANDLVRNKIHPTSIISGFRLAMREVQLASEICTLVTWSLILFTCQHCFLCNIWQ